MSKTLLRLCLAELSYGVNLKRVGAWAAVRSSADRNTPLHPHLLWLSIPRYCKSRNGIFYLIGSAFSLRLPSGFYRLAHILPHPNTPCLTLLLHRLSATTDRPVACSGDNQFRAALRAPIPLPHLIGHICTTFHTTTVSAIIVSPSGGCQRPEPVTTLAGSSEPQP